MVAHSPEPADHVAAAEVRVALRREQGEAVLTIGDDGRGFDPEGAAGPGFGLIGMRERAHLLGGSLSLHSAPGAGTVVEVRLPLAA